MLKNDELVEEFKKSISATIKSIGKNEELEINFVKEITTTKKINYTSV